MPLQGLMLQSFRCHKQLVLQFAPGVTVIVGNNAAGKTSIIEALALLSTGESFRAEQDDDMVQFGQELGRIKTKISGEKKLDEKEEWEQSLIDDEEAAAGKTSFEDELEVILTRGFLQGKAVQKKHFVLNGARKRKKDFIGHFTTVVFRPEDMRLIEGSPSRRRQFIDTILSVTHHEYAEALSTYENALKRRNRLLDEVQTGRSSRTVLNYWTLLILKHGQKVQEFRKNFFQEFQTGDFPLVFQIEYLPSIMSEERMEFYAEKEIAAGHTLIGPHKDDFLVNFLSSGSPDMINISQFGSRGQQRLAVLWLKINELQYLEHKHGQRPVLLLDDIFSELDHEHRSQVEVLLMQGQAVITTTEPQAVADLQQQIPNLQVITM